MAEADLSKIVNLIMENPKLIEQIKNLASQNQEGDIATTEAVPDDAVENSESVNEKSVEASVFSIPKNDNRARRNSLLSALKPYLDPDTVVAVCGDADLASVALSCLVHRVGKNLKKRMLAALQSVRTEDDGGALSDTVGTLESLDALVVVLLWLFCCHMRSTSFRIFKFAWFTLSIITKKNRFEKGENRFFQKTSKKLVFSIATSREIEYNIIQDTYIEALGRSVIPV